MTNRLRGVSTVSSSNEHATLPPLKQLAALGPKQVYASADPVQIDVPSTVSKSEVASHSALDGVCEYLSNQIGEVIRSVFYGYSSILWEFSVQV